MEFINIITDNSIQSYTHRNGRHESISRINIDGFGEVRQARPAARFSKTPSELSRPAPMLGEHSQEIVSSLGVDEAIIKSLIEKKVIAIS